MRVPVSAAQACSPWPEVRGCTTVTCGGKSAARPGGMGAAGTRGCRPRSHRLEGTDGKQFQQVTAAARGQAQGSGPPVRQVIGEPGYQPPVRHKAATGNGTIEHGEAPAGEDLWEDTSYYRGFASLHDQKPRTDTRSRHNGTSHQPGTASAGLRTILKRPCRSPSRGQPTSRRSTEPAYYGEIHQAMQGSRGIHSLTRIPCMIGNLLPQSLHPQRFRRRCHRRDSSGRLLSVRHCIGWQH
jgi:hypothetical protein